MIRTLLAALFLATPAAANDGFGGLSATGLHFSRTEAVAMEEEDLFIGLDQIRVAYVFRNTSAADVTGEVIFPLPPIPLGQVLESSWNLPEDVNRPNLVNFTATVDGTPVAVRTDAIAVIEPMWETQPPLAIAYDTPGRDVTADLARFGIPLTVDAPAVSRYLVSRDAATRDAIAAAGLAEFYLGEDPSEVYAFPNWSVILRYHWTQTFPAGARLRIEHAYENRPSGGIFGWTHPPQDAYQVETAARYCIDKGTSAALAKALIVTAEDGSPYSMGVSHNIAYVLRTANSWAGPIGKFRLTLDKGNARNILSLCADGVKRTGPTTFVIEKTNYTPDRDLEILIATPMNGD